MVEPVQEYRLVLVTGPSGAGRTTAINALEDMGYEVIDNLPLSFVPRLIEGPSIGRPIALGLDVRNRDFNATALIELIDRLTQDPRVALEVLYVDCSASELIRRYNQTRRRHPLAPAETPAEGVEREIDLLAPVRVRADHLIDTSEMSPHDLKAELSRWFDRGAATRLAVSVQSFSYKRGVPRGVDMIFDCRFLKNPYWVESLRALDGREASVADYISSDPRFAPLLRETPRSRAVPAAGAARGGKGPSVAGLRVHGRATPVGRRCRTSGQCACRSGLAGVKTTQGT